METYNIENPLISLCNCDGTMKYIHLECLKEWLRNKLAMRTRGGAVSYYWKNFNCELCKQKFPSKVKINGKVINLIEFQKPEIPYIILEELKVDQSHGMHIITLEDGHFARMGRGHDNELRLDDVSVSRNHASIRYKHGSFFLEDNLSKFGTLIQAQKKIRLNSNVFVQINRSVLSFEVYRPFTFKSLFCCRCYKSAAVHADTNSNRSESDQSEVYELSLPAPENLTDEDVESPAQRITGQDCSNDPQAIQTGRNVEECLLPCTNPLIERSQSFHPFTEPDISESQLEC